MFPQPHVGFKAATPNLCEAPPMEGKTHLEGLLGVHMYEAKVKTWRDARMLPEKNAEEHYKERPSLLARHMTHACVL